MPVSPSAGSASDRGSGLDRHVQGGGRLIGDQQLRLAGERHGDHDALRHAAGQFVREGLELSSLGSGMPTSLSSSDGARPGGLLLIPGGFAAPRPAGRRRDRVERRGRLLEDHADAVAAIGHLLADSLSRSRPSNRISPASICPGVLTRPQDRKGRDALAAARLADQAQDLAAIDVEVDPVDGPHDSIAGGERGLQAPDLQERLGAAPRRTAAARTSSSIVCLDRRRPETNGPRQSVID